MDYGVVSIDKKFIGSMDYECYTRDFGIQKGTYVCTLDNYHRDPDMVDWATSENPAEHKSHNLIELEMDNMHSIQTIDCVFLTIV